MPYDWKVEVFFFPLSPRRAKAALIKRYTGKFSLHEPLSSTCHRLAVPTLQLWLAVRAYGWRVMWRGGWRKKNYKIKLTKKEKKTFHIYTSLISTKAAPCGWESPRIAQRPEWLRRWREEATMKAKGQTLNCHIKGSFSRREGERPFIMRLTATRAESQLKSAQYCPWDCLLALFFSPLILSFP